MSQITRSRHELPGLRPEPLASYLAGLGLIRVLAEQADPDATAAWTEKGLVVTTVVPDIAAWLTEQYEPTPVLSPWNNGSGFGPKDKEPKRALDSIRAHPSPRLGPLREAIPLAEKAAATARQHGWLTDSQKPGDKGRAVQEWRNWCPEKLLPWIDAAVVLAGEDEFYPPLLGTGGNDGRLDFSTNFHQRLLDTFDQTEKGQARSRAWAQDLLAGTGRERLVAGAIGQFDPAAAGGPGSSPFGAADSQVNPWGYLLLVEGALLFAASAARRNEHGVGRAAIPFTVYASPDGADSGAAGEESRGEIWAPVWTEPFAYAEIRQLFAEARASWRGRPARRAVQFYAATRTLGVARGVDTFVRYGLHQRNGRSFTAVPLDRVSVRHDPAVRLVATVEDWPGRVGPDSPGAIGAARRGFDTAQLSYARNGQPRELGQMLAALTELEQAVSRSSRTKEKVPPRRPAAAQPFLDILLTAGSPELRIAAGIASCATLSGAEQREASRTMRHILLAVDPPDGRNKAHPTGRWRDTPVVPGLGIRPLHQVLADVLTWRCRAAADEHASQRREAEISGGERVSGVLTFRRGLPVPAGDLHDFALDCLDDAELEFWLRACLALDWRGISQHSLTAGTALMIPSPTLALLHPLAAGLRSDSSATEVGMRPDWASRLAAGQLDSVHDEAVMRLQQAGWRALRSPLRTARASGAAVAAGSRLAAALVPRAQGYMSVLGLVASRLQPEPRDELVSGTGADTTPSQPGAVIRADSSLPLSDQRS